MAALFPRKHYNLGHPMTPKNVTMAGSCHTLNFKYRKTSVLKICIWNRRVSDLNRERTETVFMFLRDMIKLNSFGNHGGLKLLFPLFLDK